MLSGLTIRGRCLVAAGVAAGACALVLDERDLLRVAIFVTALPLIAALAVGHGRYRFTARREIIPARVSVDSRASVRLHLGGTGFLPLGALRLEDHVPPGVGRRPCFDLDGIPRQGSIVEYEVAPKLRGIHHIGPMRTYIGDPFGLCEFERRLAERTDLVAHPRVVELSTPTVGGGIGPGEKGTAQLRAGHGEDDAVLRQYRHGDDIRRVHWKTTARRDELMVRVEETPWRGGVSVLLDQRAAAHRGSGEGSSLEWAVSAAASIWSELHARGRQPELIAENGEALMPGNRVAAGQTGYESMLDTLASLRPSDRRDLVCGSDPGHGQELVAILGATTAVGVAELTRFRPQRARSWALVLDVRSWGRDSSGGAFDPADTAGKLRTAGWSVVIVTGPDVSVSSAWSQLCATGNADHRPGLAS